MSGRSAKALANNTIPLARKGLEVAHTIGEASNLNVLKGLSGLALLILDTCEQASRYPAEYEELSRRTYELAMLIVNHIVGRPELTFQQERHLESLRVVLQEILVEIQPIGKRTRLQRLLTRQQKDLRTLYSSQRKLEEAVTLFQMNWNLEIIESVGRQNRQLVQQHQVVMDLLSEVHNSQMVALEKSQMKGPSRQDRSSAFKLPRAPVHFFGRTNELSHLVHLCSKEDCSKVTILGPGGMGKTNLAIQMLYESHIVKLYDDRRFFIQCESATSSDGLLMAIANQLGFSRSQNQPLDKIVQLFVDKSARCLLVLDNFETPWDTEDKTNVETILGTLADVQNLCVVITMRGTEMPLGVAWTRPFLPSLRPLDHDSARQAFFALNECAEDDAAVDELLEKLDRVPLAVALVGVRAQFSRPRQILDAWGAGLKLERIANRVDSVDVSIRLSLEADRVRRTPEATELLGALAMLPDGVREDVVGEVFAHVPRAHEALAVLLQTALAYRDGSRASQGESTSQNADTIRVLAPIRQYMQRMHPILPIHRACLEAYYVALSSWILKVGTSEGMQAIAILTPEIGNMHSVIGDALSWYIRGDGSEETIGTLPGGLHDKLVLKAQGEHADARLVGLMECACRMTRFQRYTSLGSSRTVETGIAAAAKLKQPNLEGRGKLALAQLRRSTGKRSEALKLAEEALALATLADDTYAMAECCHTLGTISTLTGSGAETRKHFEEGIRLAVLAGNEACQAKCLASLSEQFGNAGQLAEAQTMSEQALVIFRRLDDLTNIGMSTFYVGRLYCLRSCFRRAAECLQEAIRCLKDAGAEVESVRPLIILGEARYTQCAYDEALAYYEKGGEVLRRNQMSRKLLASYVTLRRAEAHVELGNLDEGKMLAEEAFEVFSRDQMMHGILGSWLVFGDIATRRGEYEEAEGWYGRVLGLQGKKKSSFVEENGDGHARLGIMLLRRAEVEGSGERKERLTEEALVRCVTAFAVSRSLQNVVNQAKACMSIGEVFLKQGELAGSRACLEVSMELLERVGVTRSAEGCRGMLEEVGRREEEARTDKMVDALRSLGVTEVAGRKREVGEEMVEI
ncbi:TPR-like protein [Schizopora paradoxa]|uniref:TPR-like protein n=1 Tax=Schizopora paradoxa TaxID=27342 RepID=A0A0H2RMK7_9AGAM|nr:TPR-like protein [Schizopora paradoxa]